jgi:hypothetical protein
LAFKFPSEAREQGTGNRKEAKGLILTFYLQELISILISKDV